LAEGSPGIFRTSLALPGSLARILVKSLESAIKTDASREILRPTSGLRMTVGNWREDQFSAFQHRDIHSDLQPTASTHEAESSQ